MTSSYHLIIAEDEQTIRPILKALITRLYSTATVSLVPNGATALQVYEQVGADLLIVDKNLPIIDGLELTRILRARGVTIPIIIMSGEHYAGIEARQAGATLFLPKSGIIDELQGVLPGLLPL